MALHLSSAVANVPGIGAQAVKDLRQLGISRVRDLLLHIPFRYDDFSNKKQIGELAAGDIVTIEAKIRSIHARPSKRSKMMITEAIIEDVTGELQVVWFNQPYLAKTLKPGMMRAFSGKIDAKYGFSLVSPIHEPVGVNKKTGRLIPIYRLCGTLNQSRVQNAIRSCRGVIEEFEEWMPQEVLDECGFQSYAQTLKALHFPTGADEARIALERLKFGELFLHQLLFARVRQDRQNHTSHVVNIDESFLKQFVAQLPFDLTNAQKKVIWRIIQDLSEAHPMNRLLQGDVGSGKTVVAAVAIGNVLAQKGIAAYLAPTEILAIQQQKSLQSLMSGQQIGLLTSKQAKIGGEDVKRQEVIDAMQEGTVQCVVGTHALIQDQLELPSLSLVVIDEQHRFGVRQRHALLDRQDIAPHLLSMTATPIPRSLTLSMYGDLDVSILDEMPAGRKPITTELVTSARAQDMWAKIREELVARAQVYVVCPLIDPSDALGTTSVKEALKEVKKQLGKSCSVEVLHGRLASDKKADVLGRFSDGEIDVLVSTTVVEVGVDVPNASVMVILGAERFGLAQLHQLRGRVGRGDRQSICYLVPTDGGQTQRLQAVAQCHDGFRLAEADLQLRGAGDVFGTSQSGFTSFEFASLFDVELMTKAQEWAKRILEKDPELKTYSALAEHVNHYLDQVHLE